MKTTVLKRVAAFLCAMSLCFAMASCGKKNPEDITESEANAVLSKVDGKDAPTDKDAAGRGDTEVDPFSTLEVTFGGFAPHGYVTLKDKNDKYMFGNGLEGYESVFEFTADKTDELKNGDKVKVTAKLRAKQDDYSLTQTEKEYTVEGLESYVTKLSEIPTSVMDDLKKQCEQQLDSYAENWDEIMKLKDKKFIGCYFKSLKSGFTSETKNKLYLVYKVDTILSGVLKDSDDEKSTTLDDQYYTYFAVENIQLNEDGSCKAELGNNSMCTSDMESTVGEQFKHGIFSPYKYKGFESIEGLKNYAMWGSERGCDIESTVDEKA